MGERRALLDPNIYKISEEDSQDEEVLLALRNSSTKNQNVRNNGPAGGISAIKEVIPGGRSTEKEVGRGVAGAGERVTWPHDSDSQNSWTSSDTDESRESDCWTCSSSEADDESDAESWSSSSSGSFCSSCGSRNRIYSGESPLPSEIRDGNLSTFSPIFLEKEKSRIRDDSNYFLPLNDIEPHTDAQGNVRIIEFYSSSEEEDEIEENLKAGQAPPAAVHQKGLKATDKGGGRLARFLKGKSKDASARRKSKREAGRAESIDENTGMAGRAECIGGSTGSAGRAECIGESTRIAGRAECIDESTGRAGSSSSREMNSMFHQSRPHRQLRHVNLVLSRHWNCGDTTCIETLLGIIPSKSFQNFDMDVAQVTKGDQQVGAQCSCFSSYLDREAESDQIRIAGFLANSPAAKSRQLRIGDWVRTINGIVVNSLNINFILSAIEQRHPRGHQATKHQIKVGITRCECLLQRTPRIKEDAAERFGIEADNSKIGKSSEGKPEKKASSENAVAYRSTAKAYDLLKEDASSVFFIVVANRAELPAHSELGGTISYVWPPKEQRNSSSEQTFKGLLNVIPIALTMYSILKPEVGNSHVRCQMKVASRNMDAELWSDEGGTSLYLLLSEAEAHGERSDTSPVTPTPTSELLLGAFTFKWGSLSRAFTTENTEAVNRLLTNIFSTTSKGTLQPNLPRVPIGIRHEKMEEIQDQISQFDGGHWIRHGNDHTDRNSEMGYCLGASVFSKGKLMATTMGKDLLRMSYCWILAELARAGKTKWPTLKRLLICQRSAAKDSSFVLVVGKDGITMSVVVRCQEYPEDLLKTQMREWQEIAIIILHRILTSRVKSRQSKSVSPFQTLEGSVLGENIIGLNAIPPRANTLGNAWANLKNKVTGRTPTVSGRQVSSARRSKIKTDVSQPEKYKLIFVAKIDPTSRIVGIQGEETLPEDEPWNKVQKLIPGILDKLNFSNECGYVVNLPRTDKSIWIGGRRGSAGRKLIVCFKSKDVLENLQKILDKIEEEH